MPRYGLRAASKFKLFRPSEAQPKVNDSQMMQWLDETIEKVKHYIQEIERILAGQHP
ncbi:MAG: hypothetical protein QW385_00650 [Thermoproteota archaeon]